MKKIIFQLLFFSLSGLFGQELSLDVKKSIINWTGKAAFTSYSMRGTISPKEGYLILKDSKISKSKIVINMKSIDAENKDLERHLKADDFFEVKKYSEAVFELDNVVEASLGSLKAFGDLTIKGKKDSIDFTISKVKNEEYLIISGSITVDRTNYGIFYNSPDFMESLKEQAIANEFNLYFKFYFKPK